jgi:hypothetical protein
MLGYLTIVATTVGGLLGASWWAAIACGSVLALISIVEHQRWENQLLGPYRSIALGSAALMSLVNGFLAGGAAYVLGIGTGMFWSI